MSTILDQPLSAFLSASPEGKLPPEAQAVVVRMAQMALDVAGQAGKGELLRVLSTSSPTAFLGAFAELMSAAATPGATFEGLRGRLAIADLVEKSGGLWRADEAQEKLGVTRATLQSWRDAQRILALPLGDGSFGYPVAQFAPPPSDLERPRPHPAMVEILRAAGSAIGTPELFLVLASPQPALARDDGAPRTAFEALRDGDEELVEALVRHLATPADEGAPGAPHPEAGEFQPAPLTA